MELKDKTILITGASQGIGAETAYAFAKEGAKLVLTYNKHSREGLSVSKQCSDFGASDVLVVHLNVLDDKSIANLVHEVKQKFGKIDVLINNAGVIVWKHLKDQSFKDIENQIRVNYEGLVKVTRAILSLVNEMIINIASGAGKTPYADLTTYCGTKFAVRGFSQALALEVKQKVIVVNPGLTSTAMTNFSGRSPSDVANVILDTVSGKYAVESGGEVDIDDVLS
ncbi:SDR family NAD(P)-dependent oxidoreductase [Nanoarchaeota archaeon]